MCREWVLYDLILSPPRATNGLQVLEEFLEEEASCSFDVNLKGTMEDTSAFCHIGKMTVVVGKGKVPRSRSAPKSWL